MLLLHLMWLILLPTFTVSQICYGSETVKKARIPFRKCCDGYKPQWNPFSCQPICNPGYAYDKNNSAKHCLPICSGGCGIGRCIAPDTCICFFRHKVRKTDHRCAPICSSGCLNGYCASPGKCKCNKGYSQAANQSGSACFAVCAAGCGEHRNCVAPNRCECSEGYADIAGVCSLPIQPMPDNAERTNNIFDDVIAFLMHWTVEVAICVALVITLIITAYIINAKQICRGRKQKGPKF